MNNPEGTEPLQHSLSGLPHWVSERILQQLNQLTSYEPVIGIMGKTGVGKSSLCNALFAGDVSPVSDVSACTRAPQRCRLRVGRHSMVLVDLPGVGESEVRDREYRLISLDGCWYLTGELNGHITVHPLATIHAVTVLNTTFTPRKRLSHLTTRRALSGPFRTSAVSAKSCLPVPLRRSRTTH